MFNPFSWIIDLFRRGQEEDYQQRKEAAERLHQRRLTRTYWEEQTRENGSDTRIYNNIRRGNPYAPSVYAMRHRISRVGWVLYPHYIAQGMSQEDAYSKALDRQGHTVWYLGTLAATTITDNRVEQAVILVLTESGI